MQAPMFCAWTTRKLPTHHEQPLAIASENGKSNQSMRQGSGMVGCKFAQTVKTIVKTVISKP
jgi:hypothetical protein